MPCRCCGNDLQLLQVSVELGVQPTLSDQLLMVAILGNLPAIEYAHQTGQTQPAPAQNDEAIWFNEDRDPFGALWLRWRSTFPPGA